MGDIIDGVDAEQTTLETTEDLTPDAVEFDDSTNLESDIESELEEQMAGGGDETAGETDEEEGEEPEFPPELLAAAGLTEEDAIAQFPDRESLARGVRELDARQIEQAMRAPAAPAVAAPEEKTVEEAATSDVDLESALEGWDDDTKTILQSLANQQKVELQKRDTEIARQKAVLDQLQENQTQAQASRNTQEFDEFVNGLEGWEHVFGSGTISQLNPHSIAFQNRAHLERTSGLLAQGREMSGLPSLPKDELLVRSLYSAFKGEQESVVQQQVEQKVVKRQRQMTARPTARRTVKQATKFEEALDNIDTWYTEQGVPLSDPDENDYSVI